MTQMIEVKTAELIGPALNYATAVADGWDFSRQFYQVMFQGYCPSTDWAQGGPLIEKYHVQTSFNGCGFSRSPTGEYWCAYACKDSGEELRPSGSGPTPLVAACRAIVSAKLGDVVSVPAELVGGEK